MEPRILINNQFKQAGTWGTSFSMKTNYGDQRFYDGQLFPATPFILT